MLQAFNHAPRATNSLSCMRISATMIKKHQTTAITGEVCHATAVAYDFAKTARFSLSKAIQIVRRRVLRDMRCNGCADSADSNQRDLVDHGRAESATWIEIRRGVLRLRRCGDCHNVRHEATWQYTNWSARRSLHCCSGRVLCLRLSSSCKMVLQDLLDFRCFLLFLLSCCCCSWPRLPAKVRKEIDFIVRGIERIAWAHSFIQCFQTARATPTAPTRPPATKQEESAFLVLGEGFLTCFSVCLRLP